MDEKYYALMKKQNSLLRAILLVFVLLTVLMGAALFLVVPKTVAVLNNADIAIKKADAIMTDLEGVEKDLEKVTTQLSEADITGLIENTQVMVEESQGTLKTATDKLNSIDFDTLNKAISDLQAVVEPLANMTRIF